ncbi:nitroreductase family deazaflavin-dependent oxidoreductase [soil metagenome]
MTIDSTTTTPPAAGTASVSPDRYLEPKTGTMVFNRIVAWFTRRGISIWGSRELRIVGRRSGEVRTTPVNLLTHDGATYLVAARGVTQWVRNLRAADGHGELRLGRNIDGFTSTELSDVDKVEILRAYLRRWKMEVGVFFDGIDATSTDEEILAIADGHPVFLINIAKG